jgi:hypothetical protein
VTRSRIALAGLLACGGLTLASCGGSTPHRPAPGTPGNPLHASVSQPPVDVADATGEGTSGRAGGSTKSQRGHADPLRPSSGDFSPKGEPSSGGAPASTKPAYQQLVDRQSHHPGNRFSPCNLVTQSQAQAILGKAVQPPVEAPQGPTCIYRPRSGTSMVTLAVQSMDLAKVKRLLRHRRAITLSHRSGFCGTYGQSMLYLPLSSGRVLSVAAPCQVAQGFAARALPHL